MPPTTMYNFYGLTTRRLYDGSTTGGYMQRERERERVCALHRCATRAQSEKAVAQPASVSQASDGRVMAVLSVPLVAFNHLHADPQRT